MNRSRRWVQAIFRISDSSNSSSTEAGPKANGGLDSEEVKEDNVKGLVNDTSMTCLRVWQWICLESHLQMRRRLLSSTSEGGIFISMCFQRSTSIPANQQG